MPSINADKPYSEIESDSKILDMYQVFDELNVSAGESTRSHKVLRFELDKVKMMDKNIKMSNVYFAIISKFNMDKQDIRCIFSDDNSENLIMRIQPFEGSDDKEDCEEDMICVLKSLEKTILNDITLTGVKDIKGVSMYPEHNNIEYNENTNEFEKKTKWILNTDGTNLEDILVHPTVDAYKTISNDIYEVYDTLGLEAARQVLVKELTDVFKFSGAYVNYRHINLLVDIITNVVRLCLLTDMVLTKVIEVLSLNVLLRKRRILLPERLYSVSLTELIQYHQILCLDKKYLSEQDQLILCLMKRNTLKIYYQCQEKPLKRKHLLVNVINLPLYIVITCSKIYKIFIIILYIFSMII